MKELLSFEILLPIFIILVQVFIVIFVCYSLLKKLKLIKVPYAGMEYSQVIFAAAILFASFIVFTASIHGIFQSFKTYQNQEAHLFQVLLGKSGQFFLIVLFFEILLAALILFVIKVFFAVGKGFKEIEKGNIPFSIFIGVIILGCAVILGTMMKEISEYITPHYVDFR